MVYNRPVFVECQTRNTSTIKPHALTLLLVINNLLFLLNVSQVFPNIYILHTFSLHFLWY